MFKTLRAHLADNRGDENISKMIWVAIVFVVGAILLIMVSSAFQGPIRDWYDTVIRDWFKGTTGAYNTAADSTPAAGSYVPQSSVPQS